MKIKLTKVATMLLAAALFAVPSCTDYAPEISEIKGDVKTLQTELTATDAALATLAAYVDDLEDQLTTADEALRAYIADVERETDENKAAIEAEIAQRKADIENLTKLYNDAKAILDQAVKDIADIKAQMKVDEANIDDLLKRVAVIEDQIKTITAQIEALQADVKTLFNRLQSVVYVPENPEGEAIIGLFFVEKNYKKGADIKKGYESLDATSTFDYVITPAAQAASIEALFNQKAIDIRYNIANVATKASFYADSTFKLNVTGVKSRIEGDKGIITVSAVPVIKGITDIKLAQEVQFNGQSISLSICKASAKEGVASEYEVSSEFVNASVEPVELKLDGVGYYDVEKDVVVKPDTLAIPYTDVDVHAYYKDCEPLFIAFSQRGPQTLTASMLKAAFNVEVPVKFGCPKNYRALFAAGKEEVLPAELAKLVKQNVVDTAKFFDAIPEITIQLDPAATDAQRSKLVGAEEHLVLVAALDSLNMVGTTTKAVIKKAQWTIEGTTCESAEWRLNLDYEADKNAYKDGVRYTYRRDDLRMTFADWTTTLAKLKALGVDVSEPLGPYIYANIYEVNEKGEKTLVNDPTKEAFYPISYRLRLAPKAEDNYLAVKLFKMGKTYFFDVLIDTPSTEVYIPFYFVTTDRNREPMVVNVADTTFTYKAGNEGVTVNGLIDSLWNIANERQFGELYGFKENDFKALIGQCDRLSDPIFGKHGIVKGSDKSYFGTNPQIPGDPFAGTYISRLSSTYNKVAKDSLGKFIMPSYTDSIYYYTIWGQEVKVLWNINVNAPKVTIAHNTFSVNSPDSLGLGYYWSMPNPNYAIVAGKLAGYNVDGYDFNNAFKLKGTSEILANTTVEYGFRYAPKSANITIANNKLDYQGSDDTVAVKATLKYDDIVLPTSFDKDSLYYTYKVVKPEWVGSFAPLIKKGGKEVVYSDTLHVGSLVNPIVIKLNDGMFSLKTVEIGKEAKIVYELLARTISHSDEVNTIGNFIIGNPEGYNYYPAKFIATGVNVKNIFEIADELVYSCSIPEGIKSFVTYDESNSTITISKPDFTLTQPAVVTFKAGASDTWHGTLNFTKNTGLISEAGTIVIMQ